MSRYKHMSRETEQMQSFVKPCCDRTEQKAFYTGSAYAQVEDYEVLMSGVVFVFLWSIIVFF